MLLLLVDLSSNQFIDLFESIKANAISNDLYQPDSSIKFDPFDSWINLEPIEQPTAIDLWSSDEESEDHLNLFFRDYLEEFLNNIGNEEINNNYYNVNIWETCAKYKPIHFYLNEWGVDVKQNCIIRYMHKICRYLPSIYKYKAEKNRFYALKLMQKCFKAAFYLVFFHEYFHHMTECCAIRLMTLTKKSHYTRYSYNVYQTTFNTDDNIEEALANGFSYYSLSEISHWKHLGDDIIEATRKCMIRDFDHAGPGYKRAVDLIGRKDIYFKRLNKLFSQIYSGSTHEDPMESAWRKIGLNEAMFNGFVIPELIPVRWYEG